MSRIAVGSICFGAGILPRTVGTLPTFRAPPWRADAERRRRRMTITQIRDAGGGVRPRHGIYVSSGSLYAMVCLWARMVRDG